MNSGVQFETTIVKSFAGKNEQSSYKAIIFAKRSVAITR